ncbi:MAG: phage minor head protein [Rhodobacteraceae bacterium]|nr:phage minor head protein [Paracoccaceae bacterium]MCW9041735.1 phage minor head protein [Pseudopelagicola sp.]
MMAETDRPGYSFDPGPPPEVSRFLKNKGYMPAFSWQDVEPEEHAVAFSVAKATQLDVLKDIREELQAAIDEGLPFAEFQKRLRPRLEARGWWGRKKQIDPQTGKIREVQLGSPRRLKTIYRANIRTARAAGQWERIERTKKALPYLVYLLGPSERHRPHHAAKEGLVLPVDDPFWDTWMPPNGWGCKCHVRQITRREAEERGISESPETPMREVFNSRTGEIKSIPSGIDPGWERNPGKLRREAMDRLLHDKLIAADPQIATAAMRDMASSWMVRRIAEGDAGSVPIAILPKKIAARIGAHRVVVFNDRTSRHLFEDKTDRLMDDLPEIGLLARAEKFALRTDEHGRRALHVLIEESADPHGRIRHQRNPLSAIFYFQDDGHLALVTKHRVRGPKWMRRASQKGWQLLWE